MKKLLLLLFLWSVCVLSNKINAQVASIPTSKYVSNVQQQYNDWTNTSEGVTSMFDGNSSTKWLTNHSVNWIYFQINEGFTFVKYSMQSGNDYAARDPKDWELFASSDSVNWVSIDKRTGETFATRNLTIEYQLASPASGYKHFRLSITKNNGNSATQLTDLIMYASATSNAVNAGVPVARFGVNKPYVNINEAVTYFDFSSRNPTSLDWTFPGGTPSKGNLAKQNVSYTASGKYGATLTVSNQYGSNTASVSTFDKLHDYQVLVKNPTPADGDWSTFPYPQVEIQEISGTNGINIMHQAFPNFQDSVRAIALGVCKTLYKNVQEVPAFDKVIIQLEANNGVAYKAGDPPVITINMSTTYIENTYNKDGNFNNIAYEMKGVMWHEITHAYQNVPQGAGAYDGSSDFYAFLEGEADFVRIVNGFHNTRKASQGGSYNDGYTTTGFFLVYLADTYYAKDYKKFAYEFNGTAIGLNKKWSFADALYMLIGKSLDILWKEYQLKFNTSAPSIPIADFEASNVLICKNQKIDFNNKSYNLKSATTFAWTFTGGTPSTSTADNPTGVSYAAAGTYNVSLKATNSNGSNTKTNSAYVRVLDYDGYLFDLTDFYGVISSQYGDTINGEGMAQLIDNNSDTKYITGHKSTWVQWQALGAYRLLAYSLTSGGDASERDPQNWVVKGSKDNITWVTLDAVNNNTFTARNQLKTFVIANPSTEVFTYFRIELNHTNTTTTLLQFSELQLFGITSTIDPTISFYNISKTYGDADFTVSPASTSPGAITYSIVSGGTLATITSNGLVSIKGTGAVTIKADQAASGIYAAGSATAILTINKAPLKITADNKSKVYGTANPALTMTYSGFVKGETSSVLTTQPTITATAVTSSNAGTYPISLTGGAATNYLITLVNGTLTIFQATPTLSYTGSSSGTQGNTIALTATTNSTGAVSYSVNNGTGTASVSGTTLNLTKAGTVTLVVQVAATTNYAAASIQQVITINPLPNQNPVIVFNDATKTEGDPDFAMTATSNSSGTITYSIVSGQAFASITSNGTVTIIGAGTVVVQASQAAVAGFNAGTAQATLTINRATGINNAQYTLSQFNVYPNPLIDVVNIQLNLSENCNGIIELQDLEGKVLRVVNEGSMGHQSQFNIPVSDLSSGVYVLKLITDNGINWSYKLCKR